MTSRQDTVHPSPVAQVSPSPPKVHPSKRTIVLDPTTVCWTMPPLDWYDGGLGIPYRPFVVRYVDQFVHVQQLLISGLSCVV